MTMPVRILGEKTGNYTPARPATHPRRTDPATLRLMLAMTDDINRYRQGNPTRQPTDTKDTQ